MRRPSRSSRHRAPDPRRSLGFYDLCSDGAGPALIERVAHLVRSLPGVDAVWALVGLRIFMGVLWLENLTWKFPPEFGRDNPKGLLYSFRQAEDHAVLGFLRSFVHDVVIPHFTLFGWLVFLVELTAGALLTLGLFTRLGALVGSVEVLIITLLVVQAPNEWFWTYAMFFAINLVLLLTPAAADRLSVDAWLLRRCER
jgi:thiosulfate dehydrogenase (quinone) large subunit